MRIYGAALAAVILACGAARADDAAPNQGEAQVAAGIGIMCNTSAQAERYVRLRAGGAQLEPAVNTVNAEVKDPRACGVAAVAFTRDATVAVKSIEGRVLSIVRINIVAGFDGRDWHRVPAMIQYAVMEAEGDSI